MNRYKEKPKVGNLISDKFGDMKDFPYAHKIGILDPKGIVLEDSLFSRDGHVHTSTLRCASQKGTLFLMRKEAFFKLRRNSNAWD